MQIDLEKWGNRYEEIDTRPDDVVSLVRGAFEAANDVEWMIGGRDLGLTQKQRRRARKDACAELLRCALGLCVAYGVPLEGVGVSVSCFSGGQFSSQ